MLDLDALVHALESEFGFTPVMAAEIECYVPLADDSQAGMDAFWAPLDALYGAEGLPLLRIEKERGRHQYELVTGIAHPAQLASALGRIRETVEAHATAQGITVSFAAKPYADQPSSGLHLHLHLADRDGINLYHKTEEWTSDSLRYSLGGLLAKLESHAGIFFPNDEDLARLGDVDHVPRIMGWGVNNRYCALRIPMDPDPYNKRIEHRMPCANADPEAVIAAMLEGVLHGLQNRIEPPEQSYGKS